MSVQTQEQHRLVVTSSSSTSHTITTDEPFWLRVITGAFWTTLVAWYAFYALELLRSHIWTLDRTVEALRQVKDIFPEIDLVDLDNLAQHYFARYFTGSLKALRSHALGMILTMILGMLQFTQFLRNRSPFLHRWMGRLYVASWILGYTNGLVLLQGTKMDAFMPLTSILYGGHGLFCALFGWYLARQKRYAEHREWMIRSFSSSFGAVLIRSPISGLFLTKWTGLYKPEDVFSDHNTFQSFSTNQFYFFWTIAVMGAEYYINLERYRNASRTKQKMHY